MAFENALFCVLPHNLYKVDTVDYLHSCKYGSSFPLVVKQFTKPRKNCLIPSQSLVFALTKQ